MSVIQSIRDKGAWIIFGIIALALIAFILQDGMRRGGRMFSNTDVIGKVNGTKILKGDFDDRRALQERMYGAQGAPSEQIITAVWNQEVSELLMGQEYDKLGLQVSPKELSDILFGDNSPLRQEFTDPKTGEFKANDARQAFAQLKRSKNADQIKMINSVYIDPAVQQTLRTKYQNLLLQAAYIPKWMLEKQQADNASFTSFSYVYVPYMSVSDSLAKVTDAEIAEYVKAHANEFKKEEETRSVSYITFSAAPSPNDSAEVYKQISDLKAGFAETKDEEGYLSKVGSEVPYYNSYFSKSRLQQANKDTLVKIPVGQVYGPYIDGANYTLAKMVGQRQWPDSAKVRHILIATSDPRSGQMIRPDSVGKKLIDSIQTAIKNGANFDSLCLKYSDDPGSKEKGGVYDYFPQGNMVIPFNDFAFDNPVGAKGVVKTDYGYHYVEVLGHKGMGTAYKIAYLAKNIRASQETDNTASNAAAQFAVSCKNAQGFNTGALKINKQILSANDIKQNDYMVPGIGQSRSLVRWIYEHNVGDISDPVSIGDQYIVAIISSVNPAGLMSVAEARPSVETILRNKKKATRIIDTQFKGNSLQAYATSTGAPVRQADSLSFAAPFISGVGSEPKIVGAGFNKALMNKTSTPIAGETGVFAIQVNSIGAKAIASDPETTKQGMLQSVKMLSYRGLDALRKAADIKDYRSKFF